MSTFNEKVGISVNSALFFALVNLPQAYNFTNNLIDLDLFNTSTKCPTSAGLVIHAVLFFIVTYLSMSKARAGAGVKLKHSLYGTLIFYLVSSPALFSFVASFLGDQFADSNGCPTLQGILLHAAVYCVILVAVMYLPEKNK